MIQKKILTSSAEGWNRLIERLESFKSREQYHRILETVIFCIKMIEGGRVDLNAAAFPQDVAIILEACKLLDEIAKEFVYRKNVGEFLLRPLCQALQHQNAFQALNLVKGYIAQHLPFENSVSILYKKLCNHDAAYHDDFINYNEKNPHQKLLEIHVDCLHYVESDPGEWGEVAIIMRVLDFWRTLSYNDYIVRDVRPLLELGDNLLVRIEQSASPLRKKALWRMVLISQMLVRDHPVIKTLKLEAWPAEGFVGSLFPLDNQSPSSSQSFINLPHAILKDYRPWLKDSRVIFEQVILRKSSVFKAQYDHSQHVITMLAEMLKESRRLLGIAPCEIVVCILGSTSRHDRRPYSDLEYMILHSEIPAERKKEVEVYICHLISVFELMIVGLGETAGKGSNNAGGFRVDTSLLESKSWGTPEAVAKKYVTELVLPDASSTVHCWLDRGLFEFLEPVLLECPELGSHLLLKNYREALEVYLKKAICDEDAPRLITQRFKIKREDWWKGLTRQQGIALASLCEVLHSNEKAYLHLKVGTKVNLKALYYKPLLYCGLSIALYEGWKELVSSKIIEHYCKSMPWGGEALLDWWQAALEYVLKEQVKQHLSSHSQNDSSEVREDLCWAGFDLIVGGFILPLQRSVQECLSGLLPISMLGYVLLKSYLNVRRAWLEKWEGKGLKRNILLGHPLVQILASYPDESGWSPQIEVILKRHHNGLLKLSDGNKSNCQLAGVPLEHPQSIRYLKEDLVAQCFKEGKFVGDPELSSERSQVKKVKVGDRTWYVKVKDGNLEGLMAREYMAMMLHLLLGGKPQIALGWPIKLTLQNDGKPNHCYAWISESVAGESLAETMLAFPGKWKSLRFERKNFSQLFLFTFLTCPEDGQPENFKVIEGEDGIEVIAIDYGQCFVAGDRQEKRFLGDDVSVLTLKTMIYFLDDMHKPLSEDLITRIRILDVDTWYTCWKSSMSEINELFKPILEEDLGAGPQSQGRKYKELIDLPENVMLCIKSRLALLQQWVRATRNPITGQSILESLDPLVASQYATLKPKIQTPDDFYQKIDVKAYVKNPKSGKMISRSTCGSLQQQTLTPKQLARSCNFEPEILSRVNFRQLSAEQLEYHLQVLESLPQSSASAFVRLNLSGCAIEENRLIKLLEKMSHLQELDLCGCNEINVMTIVKLLAHRPNATILTYNYEVLCPKLRVIKTTIEHKNCTLVLNLSFNQRQQLTRKMLEIISAIESLDKMLLKKLKDSGMIERWLVVEVLGRLGKAKDWVIEALVKMLDDPYEYLSLPVAVALVRLKKVGDPVVRVLLKSLESSDRGQRKAAAEALGRSERADDDVIEALLGALGKSSDEWVSHSMRMLRRAGYKHRNYSPPKNLRKESDIWAALHESFMASTYNQKGEEACTNDLEAEIAPVRASAAEALGRLGKSDGRVITALKWELTNSQRCVRVSAASALIRLRCEEERSFKVLLEVLRERDVDWLVRKSAIEALENLGIAEDSIVQSVLMALRDSNERLGMAAAQALGNLGKAEDRIIVALLSRLRDVNPPVQKSAAKALWQLGRAIAVEEIRGGLLKEIEVLKILRNYGTEGARQYAAEALSVLENADDDVIEGLLKGLNDPSSSVRIYSADTLGWLAIVENRVIAGLVNALKGEERVCIAVAEALNIILNPKSLWAGIQKKIQQLATKDLVPESLMDEEPTLQVVSESQLSQVVMNQNYAVRSRFFGRPSIAQINDKDVELSELNHVALAAQRAINVCALNGVKRHCRVIPAKPDGDCVFTGIRRVLDFSGRVEIASWISRDKMIALVRDEFQKEQSPCKSIILQIFKADGIESDDENRDLVQWCVVFSRKGYRMQEAHFKFLSLIFNIEFCFYCVDNDKKILLPKLGNEIIYEGRDQEAKIVVNLLHMTVTLREENSQLNHFDGLVINPTLEQEQRINLMLEEVANALHLKDSGHGFEDLHPIKNF